MDNVPYGTVFERILPLIFDADHPYGHLPIGNMQHLAEATLDEVSAFHARYYMPSNAVLSIVGDVDGRRRLRQGRRLLRSHRAGRRAEAGDPAGTAAAHRDRAARPRRGRAGAGGLVRGPAARSTRRTPASSPRSSLAASILGEGETSRLHRRLVRKDQIALSAGFGVNTLIAGNSLGLGSVRAMPGQDLDDVVAAVADVLHDVRRATVRPSTSSRWRGPRPSATGSTRWVRRLGAPTRSRPARCCSTIRRRSTNGCRCCARITAEEVREAAADVAAARAATRRPGCIPRADGARPHRSSRPATEVRHDDDHVASDVPPARTGVPAYAASTALQRRAGAGLRLPRPARRSRVTLLFDVPLTVEPREHRGRRGARRALPHPGRGGPDCRGVRRCAGAVRGRPATRRPHPTASPSGCRRRRRSSGRGSDADGRRGALAGLHRATSSSTSSGCGSQEIDQASGLPATRRRRAAQRRALRRPSRGRPTGGDRRRPSCGQPETMCVAFARALPRPRRATLIVAGDFSSRRSGCARGRGGVRRLAGPVTIGRDRSPPAPVVADRPPAAAGRLAGRAAGDAPRRWRPASPVRTRDGRRCSSPTSRSAATSRRGSTPCCASRRASRTAPAPSLDTGRWRRAA